MYSHTHCALRCSHIRREKPAAHNVIPIVPSTRIHTASPITFVSSLTLALLNECIFYDLLFYADIQVLLLPATFPLRAFFSTTIFFQGLSGHFIQGRIMKCSNMSISSMFTDS